MAMPFVRMDIWPVEFTFQKLFAGVRAQRGAGRELKVLPADQASGDGYINHRWCGTAADTELSRDLGYLAMIVCQGKTDKRPTLLCRNLVALKGTARTS